MGGRKEDIRRIDHLSLDMEGLYHQASRKLGISDSVSRVLYTILDRGDPCPLSHIYRESGSSKQTIHSALRFLEKAGMLCLSGPEGRGRLVALTNRGKEYLLQTVARLYRAELRAFDSWTEEEMTTYLHLMEKHAQCLGREIEKM